MINVGFDITPLLTQSKYRGIGVYYTNLSKTLKQTGKVNLKEVDRNSNKKDLDLLHYPYFDLFFQTLPFKKPIKTIVTIHDCIPLVFPKYFPSGIKGKIKFNLQKLSLKSVSVVITDSESSKKDIIKFLKVPEEKIKIVYLAADEIFRKMKKDDPLLKKTILEYDLPENFLLYVNDVDYHKNLTGLLKAYAGLNNPPILILAGKALENTSLPQTVEIINLINQLGLKDKIKILGFVPTEKLVCLYNLAKAYLHISLYEGFGLQILESFSCGCPVVTSNISSMPEVAGEAGIYVNPYDIKDIAVKIENILSDDGFRKQKIDQGLEQVKNFSWQKTAEKTIKVYEKVLAGK